MSAVPYNKVNRQQIYKEIKDLIEQSPDHEVEVSSSELADRFGVQSPTMDYHLNKLVDEGLLAISPKRGRYNRKIYRLPADSKSPKSKEKPKTEVHKPFESEDSAVKFQKFLQEYKEKKQQKMQSIDTHEKSKEDQPKEISQNLAQETKVETTREEVKNQSSEVKKPEPIEVRELTLDERIQQFLDNANSVHDANMLLGHEDREILSVMNETINQNIVYLKDLSEQLSTVQNKQLIQQLIDDRNRMQKQLERAEQEAEEARRQADQTVEKYEVDPQRVRFMHQLIIDTLDQYVNLPNHAMALGRQDFRNKISKEISDLVRYVLHLDE